MAVDLTASAAKSISSRRVLVTQVQKNGKDDIGNFVIFGDEVG
jgi:hypothetical protein